MRSSTHISDRLDRIAGTYFCFATFAYVVAGVVAVVCLSPRVPYADEWRHVSRLLTQPFPTNVLSRENGHAEIFANLIRWLDLREFAGNIDVSIAIGLLLAVATFAVLVSIVWRATRDTRWTRWPAIFVIALAIFWLGNGRESAHASEALHFYALLLCLSVAIAATLRDRLILAAVFCMLATFNYGAGVAAFAAIGALLWVSRKPAREFLPLCVSFVVTLLFYFLLPASKSLDARGDAMHSILFAFCQLGAPTNYLLWPFVDANVAESTPRIVAPIFTSIAQTWTHLFGDARVSPLPSCLVGAALLVTFAIAAIRRRENETTIARVGIALGAFGLFVAALIGVTRAQYFIDNPTQLYAPRYLPWSALFWWGMLLVGIGRTRHPRRVLFVVALVSIFGLFAEVGMSIVLHHQRDAAEDGALAAVVGVWPSGIALGENVDDEVRVGAVAMANAHVGPFAWPESQLIGSRVAADAADVNVLKFDAIAPTHSQDVDGEWVKAVVTNVPCARERLVATRDGVGVSLMRHVNGDEWRGVILGFHDDGLRLVAIGCR